MLPPLVQRGSGPLSPASQCTLHTSRAKVSHAQTGEIFALKAISRRHTAEHRLQAYVDFEVPASSCGGTRLGWSSSDSGRITSSPPAPFARDAAAQALCS